MPAPDVSVNNDTPDRRAGTVTVDCDWTAQENDDIQGVVVLDKDDLDSTYREMCYGIKSLDYMTSEDVEVLVEFDTLGDKRVIAAIPANASGTFTFDKDPSGYFPDPHREVPSDVVVSSSGSQAGDRMFLRIHWKSFGKRPL